MSVKDSQILRECPFCGGEAECHQWWSATISGKYATVCTKCNCGTDFYETEAEAIAAWNSRAERTCKWELEHSGTLYDKWRCSKCGYLFVEPRCDQGYTDLEPNYCPSCGARIEVDA